MPDEDNNFNGSLVLDFRKWWRHVQAAFFKFLQRDVDAQPRNQPRLSPRSSFILPCFRWAPGLLPRAWNRLKLTGMTNSRLWSGDLEFRVKQRFNFLGLAKCLRLSLRCYRNFGQVRNSFRVRVWNNGLTMKYHSSSRTSRPSTFCSYHSGFFLPSLDC